MKRHVRNWMRTMGYGEQDFMECEVRGPGCTRRAVDVMHIKHAGLGGKRTRETDRADNLVGGCRNCHELHGTGEITDEQLLEIVRRRERNQAK